MTVSEKREKEKELIALMISIYCKGKHKTKDGLCNECESLLTYATNRIEKCPHMETKTFCSECTTHCYAKDKRELVKEVMRYAGPRMIFHQPVTAIWHCLLTMKRKIKRRFTGSCFIKD